MKLYDTLSRSADTLKPLQDKTVKVYTCGLTVYSQPHIGNWLGYIYWDVLVRTLKQAGYNVIRTQNYTDVGHLVSDDDSGEDKMEKGARKEGLTAWDVAEKYIGIADHEAYDLLGLIRPDHLVRATDYIPQQIAFIKALEEKDYTYIIPHEGVYFDTSKLGDYGKLARLDIDGLEAGARVAVNGKRNPTDFALWKFSPRDHKRDMEWDSPWGMGFPGWHLECSVIARETLGDQIDIHTGGVDHIPVHHTNEIAQTEAVTGKQFSQMWVHNNHIKVDGTKISKSLGNIYTLQDIVDKNIPLAAFKVMVLSKHYRTEGNFTWEILESAHNRLKHWQEIAALRWQLKDDAKADNPFPEFTDRLKTYLEDNLDTPHALALFDEAVDVIEQSLAQQKAVSISGFTDFMISFDQYLGFTLSQQKDISQSSKDLITKRQVARDKKDWATSDACREELIEQGIAVRDTPSGPYWYYL